jgi:hypothetical protein
MDTSNIAGVSRRSSRAAVGRRREGLAVWYHFPSSHEADREKQGEWLEMEVWLYRLLVALSGIALVLVIAYILLVQDERTIQAEVNQRQQFINQSIQLGRVNEALIRVLAANAGKDDKLRELLAQNGISINAVTGAPERETAPPPPAPAGTPR